MKELISNNGVESDVRGIESDKKQIRGAGVVKESITKDNTSDMESEDEQKINISLLEE